MTAEALAVVPVDLGVPGDPGPPALRELLGVPLITRAVSALARSGCVGQVVVTCPRPLVTAVADLVGGVGGSCTVEVVAGVGPAPVRRLLDVLAGHQAGGATSADVVVVHDPLHPLASAHLVSDVVRVLAESPPDVAAVVPVRPVTDSLKWVGEGVVLATADRAAFRMVYSPQAYRTAPLLAALRAATSAELGRRGADVVPQLVQHAGGRLVSVPAPGEVFRVSTVDDLDLAEAMLHVGATSDDEPAAHRR